MKKSLRLLTTIVSAVALSVGLVGCGSSASSTTQAKGGKTITVWTHWKQGDEVKAIDKAAQVWAKNTGNTVKVVLDNSDFQAYTGAAQSAKGPDIMYGIPHDNLGTFQKAGLLDEVPSGVINDSDYTSKALLDSVTFGGKRYAVPLGAETYALFYNTDMVKTPPKTTDELVESAKTVGFQYEVYNFYFSWGWIAGNGGYIFKNNSGTLDPKDLGLGNNGAIKGYQFIQDLVAKDKLMKADITQDSAKGNFTQKKIGMYMSGGWDVANLKTAGVPFAVAPLPTINGNPTKSFMGVQAGFVSSKSKNKTEAWDLMKYLTANSFDIVYKSHGLTPVLNSDIAKDEFKSDKIAAAFAEQLKAAEPMPNITEMGTVWDPGKNNLQLLVQGKQDAAACGANIVKQVSTAIANIK
jgi:arabinogalactan oligomer/maltooligosaccharide transport system substrate-binding protein